MVGRRAAVGAGYERCNSRADDGRVCYHPIITAQLYSRNLVADKSSTYKKKRYLWLYIDGKRKRFEPKKVEWEAIQPGDTTAVLVGKGLLGFEVILQFGTAGRDSLLYK